MRMFQVLYRTSSRAIAQKTAEFIVELLTHFMRRLLQASFIALAARLGLGHSATVSTHLDIQSSSSFYLVPWIGFLGSCDGVFVILRLLLAPIPAVLTRLCKVGIVYHT